MVIIKHKAFKGESRKLNYKIIADSSCDLSPSDLTSDKFDFTTVPISIIVGNTSYTDDVSLDTKNLLSAMKVSSSAFKTAAPSPEAFAAQMRTADNVICLTLSSKISGTYNSARLAAETVLAESPEKNIFVLDSLTTSAAMALLLRKLKTFLENESGVSFEDTVKQLVAWRSSVKIRFILQDMSNLAKSGRMSKVAAWIASVLPVKLICGDNGAGEIKMYSKVLGAKRSLAVLAQTPAEKVKAEGLNIPIIITHCHNEAAAEFLKSTLKTNLGLSDITVYPMRGTASVYASDKGLAVAF